jgi:hypothetical protein
MPRLMNAKSAFGSASFNMRCNNAGYECAMSVAIHPRVEEEPRATAINGWLVASAARVWGSRGVGRSPAGGQSAAKASEGKSRKASAFFFEKKKQKTFAWLSRTMGRKRRQMDKSFLLLFFKKEVLP